MPARGGKKKKGGGLSKDRLLRRVGRMCDDLAAERKRRTELLEREIREAEGQLADATKTVRLMRDRKGTAAFESARATRAAALARVEALKKRREPSTELEDLDAHFARQKIEREGMARELQEQIDAETRRIHRKHVVSLGRRAKHPDRFRMDQPGVDLLRRKLIPLGESDPSLLKVPWHRDDFRLPKGKPGFRAVPSGRGFPQPPPPPKKLLDTLGGPGTEPGPLEREERKEVDRSGSARHARAWRPVDTSGGILHEYAHWPPLTEHEARRAAAATRPERLSYDPRRDGKRTWLAPDPVGSLFSTFERDDEWMEREERRKREAMEATLRRMAGEMDDDAPPTPLHAQFAPKKPKRKTPLPPSALAASAKLGILSAPDQERLTGDQETAGKGHRVTFSVQ